MALKYERENRTWLVTHVVGVLGRERWWQSCAWGQGSALGVSKEVVREGREGGAAAEGAAVRVYARAAVEPLVE